MIVQEGRGRPSLLTTKKHRLTSISANRRQRGKEKIFFRSSLDRRLRQASLQEGILTVSGVGVSYLVRKNPIQGIGILGNSITLFPSKQAVRTSSVAAHNMIVNEINNGNKTLAAWFINACLEGRVFHTVSNSSRASYYYHPSAGYDDARYGHSTQPLRMRELVSDGAFCVSGSRAFIRRGRSRCSSLCQNCVYAIWQRVSLEDGSRTLVTNIEEGYIGMNQGFLLN